MCYTMAAIGITTDNRVQCLPVTCILKLPPAPDRTTPRHHNELIQTAATMLSEWRYASSTWHH